MPGVPRSRGCNLCRKQRKKCDTSQTPCPRCRRLGLACIGQGEQRFKFQDESRKWVVTQHPGPQGRQVAPSRLPWMIPSPSPRLLSNETTSLTSAFVGRIEDVVDIRFQLPWNFGAYLREVPRRLGSSASLDAASDALVASHRDFCMGRRFEPDHEILNKHTRALSVLRHELGDHTKARSSETLCAIMLLMITELFVDPACSSRISHAEGAARLLKSRGIILDHVNDDFEGALLLSLRGSVVAEALLNDDVDFTRQEWDRLVEQRIDVSSNHGKLIQCLAQVPALMKRSKAALRFGESVILCIPELVLDTNILRARCSTIIANFRHYLDLCNNDEGLLPIEVRNHMHARQLRILGLAFATGIILNCILTALDGPNLTIHHESSTFSNEIVKLAHLSLRYRPLGSMLFLSNLTFAWIGAAGPDRRNEIQAMLGAYESVCLGRNFTDWDLLLEQRRKRFCLEEDTGPEGAKKGHLAFGQGSACGM